MAARVVVPPDLLRDRSTSKLSEVAKRIAVPRDIVGTDWGPISNTCRDEMGIEFDGWQDGCGQLMLARNDSGLIAHTIGGFHLAGPRQYGKTFFGSGGVFGMCQHFEELLCVWTAHHSATSDETFAAMQGFAARPMVAPFIDKIYTGSGDEEIRFHNGSRILFGARERGFGRGIPGVDVLISDEGQIMSQRAMQNMIATLNTSLLGLHMYFGTPPKPEDNSENWMNGHDEAWAIEDSNIVVVQTDDLVWIEFGADDDAELDDMAQWARANPSFPHRTPIQSIQRLRRKLDDDGFRREGLGLYDETGGSVFDISRWRNDLAVPETVAQPDRAMAVLDVSPDRTWSCIGTASALVGMAETDDEVDRALIMVRSMRGTDGVAAALRKLVDERKVDEVAITPGAARALETDLTKLGVDYEIMTASEVAAAFGNLQVKIRSGEVAHLSQGELDTALVNVKTRFLNTGEAEAFDRRGYTVDVSPAVAAACALYRFGLNPAMPFIL